MREGTKDYNFIVLAAINLCEKIPTLVAGRGVTDG